MGCLTDAFSMGRGDVIRPPPQLMLKIVSNDFFTHSLTLLLLLKKKSVLRVLWTEKGFIILPFPKNSSVINSTQLFHPILILNTPICDFFIFKLFVYGGPKSKNICNLELFQLRLVRHFFY